MRLPNPESDRHRGHPNIEREIEAAAVRATNAEREFLEIRAKYRSLLTKHGGPFTLEMIETRAKYVRGRRECTEAKERLRALLAIRKLRKESKVR
jgi:hypothetical protein